MKSYLIDVEPSSLIYWQRTYELPALIKNFFSKGMHKHFPYFKHFENTKRYLNYQSQLGVYTKCVWLTNEYITNNSQFKNPLSLTWNKDKQLWIVHPGGHRSVVQYYFPTKTLLGITKEKVNEYKEKFSNIEQLQKFVNAEVTDTKNGLFFDTHDQYDQINKMRKQITKFYRNTKITSNFDLTEFGYNRNIVDDPKQNVHVTIENSTTNLQAIRALLLLPTFKTFNNYGVKIERT